MGGDPPGDSVDDFCKCDLPVLFAPDELGGGPVLPVAVPNPLSADWYAICGLCDLEYGKPWKPAVPLSQSRRWVA